MYTLRELINKINAVQRCSQDISSKESLTDFLNQLVGLMEDGSIHKKGKSGRASKLQRAAHLPQSSVDLSLENAIKTYLNDFEKLVEEGSKYCKLIDKIAFNERMRAIHNYFNPHEQQAIIK